MILYFIHFLHKCIRYVVIYDSVCKFISSKYFWGSTLYTSNEKDTKKYLFVVFCQNVVKRWRRLIVARKFEPIWCSKTMLMFDEKCEIKCKNLCASVLKRKVKKSWEKWDALKRWSKKSTDLNNVQMRRCWNIKRKVLQNFCLKIYDIKFDDIMVIWKRDPKNIRIESMFKNFKSWWMINICEESLQ